MLRKEEGRIIKPNLSINACLIIGREILKERFSNLKNIFRGLPDQRRRPGFNPWVGMEEAMAPHSSTLAWKLPWTEGPGGLQSMGPQKVDMTERLSTAS